MTGNEPPSPGTDPDEASPERTDRRLGELARSFERIDRRTLLQGAAVTGAGTLAGCWTGPDDDAVSGVVRDVKGEAVGDASVRAFALDGTDVDHLGTVCSDGEGRFAFTFERSLSELRETYQPETLRRNVMLVATVRTSAADVRAAAVTTWFGTVRVAADEFFDAGASHDVTVDGNLLYGPAQVTNDEGIGASEVTAWRRIHRERTAGPPEYPAQTIGVEVRGMPRRLDTGGIETYRVGDGVVTVQTPESVPVQYPDGDFSPEWSAPHVFDSRGYTLAVTEETIATMHDASTSVPTVSVLGDAIFSEYGPDDLEKVIEQRRAWRKMLSLAPSILGVGPTPVAVLATLLGIGLTAADPDPPSPVPSADDPQRFFGNGPSEYDPNHHDLVRTAWLSPMTDPPAVTLRVPLRFEDPTPRPVATRAVWYNRIETARLDHWVQVDPTVVTPGAVAEPCESGPTTTRTTVTSPTTQHPGGSTTTRPGERTDSPGWTTTSPPATPGSLNGIYDDFEDGNYTSDPAWEERTGEGENRRVSVVERESPDGGSMVLRLYGNSISSTIVLTSGVAWEGWDSPWVIEGLFYPERLPGARADDNPDNDFHVLQVGAGFEVALMPTRNRSNPEAGRTTGIVGRAIESPTFVESPVTEGSWFRYRFAFDGEGAYTGQVWPDGEPKTAGVEVSASGTPPPTPENLMIKNSGGSGRREPVALVTDHAFVRLAARRGN